MVLVLLVAVLGLLPALAGRGFARLAELPVRAVRLVVVAALLQVLVAALAPRAGWAQGGVLVPSCALVALFLVGNRGLPGVPLIAAGLLLNAATMLVNGAMPVSTEAAKRAGVAQGALRLADDPLREPVTADTRLGLLGDVVPVALPWRPQVVSPGDVLVAAGIGLMLVAGSARRADQPLSRVDRSTIFDSDSTTRGSYS